MRSGSSRSRYAIGSNPKLMLLACTLCRSSRRSQSELATTDETHSTSEQSLAGGSIRVAMFSTIGRDPTRDAARARFEAVASIVAFVRGAAARWPISMSPARTDARCSDQNAGLTRSTRRASLSSRRASTDAVDAGPSATPCTRRGTWCASVSSARAARDEAANCSSAMTSTTSMRSRLARMPAASAGCHVRPNRSVVSAFRRTVS